MEQQSFAVDARRHSVAWLFAGVFGAASVQEAFLSCTTWRSMTISILDDVTIWDELTSDEKSNLKVLLLVRGRLEPITLYENTLMRNLDVFENTQSDESRRRLLHLTQEFVHEHHKKLQTNLWIVDPFTTYCVLLCGELPELAMKLVSNAALKSLREHHPFNNPHRQCPDAQRWLICRTIAADWTILTLSLASNHPPDTFDWLRDDFFGPIHDHPGETPDGNVQRHLVQAMEQCFADANRNFHIDVKVSSMYVALMSLLYQKHSEYESIFMTPMDDDDDVGDNDGGGDDDDGSGDDDDGGGDDDDGSGDDNNDDDDDL